MCQNVPQWAQLLLVILAILPHLLAVIPPQYKGAAILVFAVLDKIAGNYAACANKPAAPAVIDAQDSTTPRP